jgi:hypothetical protein
MEIFGSVDLDTLLAVAIVLFFLYLILPRRNLRGGKHTRARKPKRRRKVSSKKKRGKSKSVRPCPLCYKEYGGFLIIQQNSDNNSKFLECIRYPDCEYTRGYRDYQS